MNEIVAKGTTLPSPTEIGTSDELIWSSGTGRNASGNMVGDLIAQKKTIAIKWGILTKADMKKIESCLTGGFFSVQILGETFEVYRGSIQSELLGTLSDGVTYYRSVSVSLIQR